jgi:hypothetical protein
MRRSVRRSLVVVVPRRHRPQPGEHELPLESIVTASIVTATERAGHGLRGEYRAVVELARQPVSLIEIGAAIAAPLSVVRVLVADLVRDGHLDVHAPPPAFAHSGPSPLVHAQLLRGLRRR